MFIRYFARTDESATGRVAAAYCDALVGTGIPVRLVTAHVAELQLDRRGRSSSLWDRHRALLATPMSDSYVNVICGEVADWRKFWTVGVTNVVLLVEKNLDPVHTQPELIELTAKFDWIYAPSADIASAYERVTGLRPIPIPLGTDNASGHMQLTFGALR